jgi:hypothetical protein
VLSSLPKCILVIVPDDLSSKVMKVHPYTKKNTAEVEITPYNESTPVYKKKTLQKWR